MHGSGRATAVKRLRADSRTPCHLVPHPQIKEWLGASSPFQMSSIIHLMNITKYIIFTEVFCFSLTLSHNALHSLISLWLLTIFFSQKVSMRYTQICNHTAKNFPYSSKTWKASSSFPVVCSCSSDLISHGNPQDIPQSHTCRLKHAQKWYRTWARDVVSEKQGRKKILSKPQTVHYPRPIDGGGGIYSSVIVGRISEIMQVLESGTKTEKVLKK